MNEKSLFYNSMIFQVFWDHRNLSQSVIHSCCPVVWIESRVLWFRSAVIAYPLCLMTTIHTGRLISRVRIGWSATHSNSQFLNLGWANLSSKTNQVQHVVTYRKTRLRRSHTHMHIILTQGQCWGKLLLKVMRYNIALLPKKVTNYVT